MKTSILTILLILFFIGCKSSKIEKIQNRSTDINLLFGLWKVTAFRFNDGRVMLGEYMGNPEYEFTKEGNRIKTLNTEPAPPAESVEYKIEGDSIKYPQKPKFPNMKIVKLSKDTLVLSNKTLSWYLHK
ncbi:MAG: hypothetical protein MK207_14145 [Saprospiraceae bacterium]|nr:hypothetical protein [Saprospiraceae bacterium]